jgi:hypothetical protein
MTSQCSGQDMRNLRVALYKCQHRGTETEIFSDKLKVKYRKYDQYVYKGKMPSCIN